MRHLLLTATLLLTLGATDAQTTDALESTTPRLSLAPGTGVVGGQYSARLDLKLRLGHHFGTNLYLGTNAWRKDGEAVGSRSLRGANFESSHLRGGVAHGLGLLAYAKPDHTGLFGGIAFSRQRYKIEATSTVPRPDDGDDSPGVGTGDPGILILLGLFSLLEDRSDPEVTAESRGRALATTFTAGYAHRFATGHRVEFTAELTRRSVGSAMYAVPDATPAGQRFRVSDHFEDRSWGVRVAYLVPLLR